MVMRVILYVYGYGILHDWVETACYSPDINLAKASPIMIHVLYGASLIIDYLFLFVEENMEINKIFFILLKLNN